MVQFVKTNYERCVLPGVSFPLGKDGNYLVDFFKENYGINITYLEQTKTKPGSTPDGARIDQIFNVEEDSLEKFAEIKSDIGAKYIKEIIRNNEHHAYIERIFLTYFQRAENELFKAGEIAEEDRFQLLGLY